MSPPIHPSSTYVRDPDNQYRSGRSYSRADNPTYDQAEAVFEKLATSREADVVVRAEFLRGVLAHRRGDQDEARAIFRNVLDRVPNIELANQI